MLFQGIRVGLNPCRILTLLYVDVHKVETKEVTSGGSLCLVVNSRQQSVQSLLQRFATPRMIKVLIGKPVVVLLVQVDRIASLLDLTKKHLSFVIVWILQNDIQWIPLNRDQFLQTKKSRLTEIPLYPKTQHFIYCYLVNGYLNPN